MIGFFFFATLRQLNIKVVRWIHSFFSVYKRYFCIDTMRTGRLAITLCDNEQNEFYSASHKNRMKSTLELFCRAKISTDTWVFNTVSIRDRQFLLTLFFCLQTKIQRYFAEKRVCELSHRELRWNVDAVCILYTMHRLIFHKTARRKLRINTHVNVNDVKSEKKTCRFLTSTYDVYARYAVKVSDV